MKMFLSGVSLFLLALSSYSYGDECFQMVERSDLKPQVINGVEVFVVKKSAIHQQCNLYQKARQAALEAQAQSKERLKMLEEMNAKYKDLYKAKESYYDLVLRYEKALDKSSALITNFESHSDRWAGLYSDYSNLADDYDKLSDTYRAIAMNFTSPISFDIGGGVTEDHGFAGLVGVGIHRVKVWGLLQEDNSGILATYTFPWSSL